MADVYRSQHGSVSDRLQIVRDAALSYLARPLTLSRVQLLFLSASRIVSKPQPPSVIREFNYTARRGRIRFSPLTSIDRKPPASTWSAGTNLGYRETRMTTRHHPDVLYAAIHAANFLPRRFFACVPICNLNLLPFWMVCSAGKSLLTESPCEKTRRCSRFVPPRSRRAQWCSYPHSIIRYRTRCQRGSARICLKIFTSH